jgi:16S rRNA (guanine527-N7)-methyltransferase
MSEALSDDPRAVLRAGARELGLDLAATDLARLMQLAQLLLEWNERFNLTAIRDPVDVVRKHLLDSLSVHPLLRGARVADVGSGAGFPGLPLAIADPAREFTLIESTAKKVRFINEAITQLALSNAVAQNVRAEGWRPAQRFDTVLARAVGSLADLTRVAGHLCAPGGVLIAMKGRYPHAEIAALPAPWRVAAAERLLVPGLEAERHAIVLAR